MQNLIGLLFLILPFSDGDGQIHLATCSKGIPSLFSIAIARRVAIPMLASPAPCSTYMKVNFLWGVLQAWHRLPKHLEEEGVILEPGVGRLHCGQHPCHGHARRALDVIVECAEPAQQGEIYFKVANKKLQRVNKKLCCILTSLTCSCTSRGI